jgi:hypothetical protein
LKLTPSEKSAFWDEWIERSRPDADWFERAKLTAQDIKDMSSW